jgi:hypothetical protein
MNLSGWQIGARQQENCGVQPTRYRINQWPTAMPANSCR